MSVYKNKQINQKRKARPPKQLLSSFLSHNQIFRGLYPKFHLRIFLFPQEPEKPKSNRN